MVRRAVTGLAVAVVGHSDRRDAAEHLADQLDGPLFLDGDGLGMWRNHARALGWATEQPVSHVLVIQDDAVPVPHLLDHVGAAVEAHPFGPIGLYVGQGSPRTSQVERAVREAERVRASWLEANTLLWGVATVFPVPDLPPMLAWCRRSARRSYDQRVGSWYWHKRRRVRYTWPSLVDHADWPTLTGGQARRKPRVAWRVGEPASWDGPVVPIGARWQTI